jgi:hypothetical protein
VTRAIWRNWRLRLRTPFRGWHCPQIMGRRTVLRLLCWWLAILILRPAMGDNVSEIEQFWIMLTWLSVVASCWGLIKARRSFIWVGEEMAARPQYDWVATRISTINHIVTHAVLFAVQVNWLVLGVFLGFQPPAPSTDAHVTAGQIVFTVALIISELLLTGLNFMLVINRTRLVYRVQHAGGD